MNRDVSQEKKNEYSSRRTDKLRSMRREWRRAVKANDFSGRNLEFLIYMCRSMCKNYKEFADLLGRSQANFSYWLVTDDVHLGTLQDSFLHMGLRLTCRLELREDSPLLRSARADTDSPLVTVRESDEGRFGFSVTIPECMIQTKPQPLKFGGAAGNVQKEARLYFLADVMRECNMRLRHFCQTTNVSYMRIFKNLMADDILVSTINEIAANGGMTVKWNLVPAGEKKQEQPS